MEKQNDRLIIGCSIFLVLQLLLDFIGTRLIDPQQGAMFISVAKGIKVLVLMLMCGVLIRRNVYQPLYGLLVLGGMAILGQWLLYPHWSEIPWLTILREWMLYGSGIVMAFFFKSLYLKGTSSAFTFTLRLTLGVIVAICCSIIIGFIFEILLFKTYRGGLRFGYTGLLHKSVAATYFFIGSICLSYYYAYIQQRWSAWLFYLILSSSFLVGTKGIYLFHGLFFLYICWTYRWYKKIAFYLGVVGVCLGAILLGIYSKIEYSTTYKLFQSIYQEHGLVTSLMSFRNEIFAEKAALYGQRWLFGNYFVGGKLPELGLFEMSFVDLYVFFGGFGLIYVLFLYYKSSIILYKENKDKQYLFFCSMSVLIISIFVGQLFVNFSSLFFILWVLFLINNGKIVKKINESVEATQHFFDIDIANLTMSETIAVINKSIDNKQPILHIVVNAAKLVNMQHDEELKESILKADLVNADGMAVVWASKILGKPLKERVAGIDLFDNLVKNASERNEKIFLLGAKEEVVTEVARIYAAKYGEEIIGGFRNGYFTASEEQEIVEAIVKSQSTYLFVAMSSPKKEIFLSTYKEALSSVGFIMGVGGSFDVISGKVKRAPVWMQKIGMEWFYRFLQEPKRMWKRSFVDNGKFLGLIATELIRKK
ncbi:WecB/TagA/CpsF family glycosyltransferase [Myroides odoratus]|uniref:WecB/TagA/CpsF family glycosyltransferase n=1 Tax=Myroides odoratus TaxID=256 RepID=UPI003341C410